MKVFLSSVYGQPFSIDLNDFFIIFSPDQTDISHGIIPSDHGFAKKFRFVRRISFTCDFS